MGAGRGVIGLGRDWLVPPPAREFDDPAEAAWASPRRTPQPVGCFTEPVRLARPLEDYPFTRTYIRRPASPGPSPAVLHVISMGSASRLRLDGVS